MNMKQDVYNEIPDLATSIISIKYRACPDVNSIWVHRDIIYNGVGVPILKLYKNETKRIYKDVYVNGIQLDLKLDYTAELHSLNLFENSNEPVCEIIYSETEETYIDIKALNVGTYRLSVNDTASLDKNIYPQTLDTDLIIIVEEEPTIVQLKWGHENPLIVNSLDNITLSLKALYSDNHEYYFDNNVINKLNIVSSNPYAATVTDTGTNEVYKQISPHNYDRKCQIKIIDDSLLNVFGEFVSNIEPLMVVISKDIDANKLVSSTFSIVYPKQIPLMRVDDEYSINIYETYTFTDETELKYDITKDYIFTANSANILINKNELIAGAVGESIIVAAHQSFIAYSDMNEIIQWNVQVIKTIKSIDWGISEQYLNIGVDTGTLYVIVTYTDNTIEDITSKCAFKYDEKLISIENNIVTPIHQGETDLVLLQSELLEDMLLDDTIPLKIILPVSKAWLNEHLLQLKIGDKRTLEFNYEPDDATPMELEWTSTEPDIVNVNSEGEIEVLNRGIADIIVSIKDHEDDNPNIFLPENLKISSITNDKGLAEIKLLDSVLYTVKIYNNRNNAISNATIIYSNISEQELFITIDRDNLINYEESVFVAVNNFYGDKVNTMKVSCYLKNSNGEIIDTIITRTNKEGIANVQSLNKTTTAEDGSANIDGINVIVKYIDKYLSNVEINHEEKNKLVLTIPQYLELEEMKRLHVIFPIEYEDDLLNLRIKIYNQEILIFDDYIEIYEHDENDKLFGKIIIESFEEVIETDDDEETYFNDNDEITNLLEYNPTKCAVCKVMASAIEVTNIEFQYNEYSMSIKGSSVPVEIIVTPENASFTKCSFKIEDESIAQYLSNTEIYGNKEGTTKIIAILDDNSEIYAEATVRVIDSSVKSIEISGGNDTDYEWYDHLNEKRFYQVDGEYMTSGQRVTNEKYDDDDMSRYYLPVNNSLQLRAAVLPSSADNKDIKWMSSNSNLVKINDKGIITAIRPGKQELDVYGDDDISETRIANTVWITAVNTRYKKYAMCQVRVTRNKVLAINIPIPKEHDVDEDDIARIGRYDSNSEHEFDYIMHVGDTIKIPVNLVTQDENFGTSDSIAWLGSYQDIIELANKSPNHSNAKDDDFDWNVINPHDVNSNKNNYELEVTAVAIGDTYFYAQPYDNVRSVTKKQLYVPNETMVVEIPNSGIAKINSHGIGSIRVDWISKNNTAIADFKEVIRKENIPFMIEDVTRTIKYKGVTIYKNCEDLLDEVIDDTYIAKYGAPVVGAKCMINPNGSIKIIIPESCRVENLKTNKTGESVPVSFTYNPYVDTTVSFTDTSDGREILNTDSADEYIQVTIYDVDDSKKIIPIFLDALVRVNNNNEYKHYMTNAYTEINSEIEGNISKSYFPSSEKIGSILSTDIGDPFNARPGLGTWIDGPKSRKVKIRVVATPGKLNIGWINAYNDELLNVIKSNSVTRDKWGKDEYRYMAIGYDEDFKELLDDASNRKEELAEKYKAFAWFSDNEDVIRFEDVEDLEYKTETGKDTNNPNENYQQIKVDPVKIHFKNINVSRYSGYRNINTIADAKFGENYSGSFEDDIRVNNANLCIIKLTAPTNGRFCINHSGSIQYAYNESFENAKTLSVDTGFHDSYIGAARGDEIYIKGAKVAEVYIKSLYFYENNVGPGFWGSQTLCDKSPSEYVSYKDLFYLKLPGDDAKWYSSDDGVILYDESTSIRFTPEYEANVTITFLDHNIKIKNSRTGSVSEIGKSQSPYTFKAEKNSTYTIFGTHEEGTTVESIEYTNIMDGVYTGSFKGTNNFKVKPSYMKRVICEGKGTAKIYVMSPKGDTLINLTVRIK